MCDDTYANEIYIEFEQKTHRHQLEIMESSKVFNEMAKSFLIANLLLNVLFCTAVPFS